MSNTLAKADTAKLVESLVVRGDLSGLSATDKAKYYAQVCESVGLSPVGQPFALLKLQGKEILYATRGATDQLAALHRITREIIDGPKEITLAGTKLVYCACKATHPNGRTETSIKTVPLADPVNVLMKCETGAKRRATLAILGLGMLDESELETIPANVKEECAQVEVVKSATLPEPQYLSLEEAAVEYLRRELAGNAEHNEALYRKTKGRVRESGAKLQAKIALTRTKWYLDSCEKLTEMVEAITILRPELVQLFAKQPNAKSEIHRMLTNAAFERGCTDPADWIKNNIAPILRGDEPPTGGGAPSPTAEQPVTTATEAAPGTGSAVVAELRKSIAEHLDDPKLSAERKVFAVGTAYAKRRHALGRHDREGWMVAVEALQSLGSGDEVQASARLDGIVAKYDSRQQQRRAA